MASSPAIDAVARSPLGAWLRDELAPRPGRLAAVARIALSCAITVVIAMVYEIPLPAYMAYIVFLTSRDEPVGTLVTAVGGGIAATFAIALSLLFFCVDAAEPAVRIALMAVSTFVGVFLTRTSTVGPVAFLAGFVLVLTQTLIDDAPSTEALTRGVLWLWVVVAVPSAVTTLVNFALGRSPGALARQAVADALAALADALRTGRPLDVDRERANLLAALPAIEHARLADVRWSARSRIDAGVIEALLALVSLVNALPASATPSTREALAQAADQCRRDFAQGDAGAATDGDAGAATDRDANDALGGVESGDDPTVAAIAHALQRLHRLAASSREAAATPARPGLFVPDAFTNPEYARFALKTTIAVMSAYFIYTLLDWPGIRTAVTTCFFVTLASLGETMHKLTLRLGGALVGGLAAGLCIVAVLPQMTDVGQLALLIAAASAACAWVSTGSPAISYGGMQMAFAFFLGVLQGYGPTTELTVLRDRIAGIVLGNVLVSIVFSVLWPTSAFDRVRALCAQALHALGDLVRVTTGTADGARLRAIKGVAEARALLRLAQFEGRLLRTCDDAREAERRVTRVDRLATAVLTAVEQPLASQGTSNAQDATEARRRLQKEVEHALR